MNSINKKTEIPISYKVNGLHFRVFGKGPVLVLFHPSPNNGNLFHGFATILSQKYTVICVDTPGYGNSDLLAIESPELSAYVSTIHKAFQSLGLEKISIYGSATGGQLAIRYGLMYPDSINQLFLDNCAHFTDEEIADVLEDYFPDLTPQLDGSHLKEVWGIVRHLFTHFPWCNQTEEFKLSTPIPDLSVLQYVALDYLKAGKEYDRAYKAAFKHEKVDHILKLKIPATIIRWENSIVKRYTDRIFDFDLPENVKSEHIAPDPVMRYENIYNCICNNYPVKENIKYDWSEYIVEEKKNSKINADIANVPEVSNDGSHLYATWSLLREKYKNDTAKELQLKLIQCYS